MLTQHEKVLCGVSIKLKILCMTHMLHTCYTHATHMLHTVQVKPTCARGMHMQVSQVNFEGEQCSFGQQKQQESTTEVLSLLLSQQPLVYTSSTIEQTQLVSLIFISPSWI